MRGVSAQSLASLETAVDAAVRDGADPTRLGDELLAVVNILDAQPSLRRMLTDPATEVAAKTALVDSLFGARVDAATVGVLKVAADVRWTAIRDLGDALELAGVQAHLAAAEAAHRLDDLEDELFRFSRLAHADRELRSVLSDRTVPLDRKRELVSDLLAGKVPASTVAVIQQAVAARRRSFEVTLADFGELAAKRRDQLTATVRAAYALSDDEQDRLAAVLRRVYGKTVHLNLIVDPEVLGGMSIEIGDEVIEATVSGRLEAARRKLAS